MLRIAQTMTVLLVPLALALAWPATAQQDAEPQGQTAQRPTVDEYFSASLVEANRVLNRTVLDQTGQILGEVADILVDPDTGRMVYAVTERGERLSGERVLVPYQALQYSYADRAYSLHPEGYAMGLAPPYESPQGGMFTVEDFKNRYGQHLARAYREGRRAAQMQPVPPQREAASPEDETAPQERDAADGEAVQPMARDRAYRPGDRPTPSEFPKVRQGLAELERLRNREVLSRDGQSAGTLDTILVEPAAGMLRIAVIQRGGFLGIGQSLVAVPWTRLRLDWQSRELVADMSSDELEQAPQVDPNRRQVIFQDVPSGYKQFFHLEQRGKGARELRE